jgi:predicted branched-subunit amino acid permease
VAGLLLYALPGRFVVIHTRRAPLAYLITDPAIAVTLPRFQRDDGSRHKHWFFLGSAVAARHSDAYSPPGVPYER